MWSAATQISTAISLVAFIAAIGLVAYRSNLKSRADVIKSLPEGERATTVQKELNAFGVRAENISEENRYLLAVKELELRATRMKITAYVIVALAIIAAIVAVKSMEPSNPEPKPKPVKDSKPTPTITTKFQDGPNVSFGCEESNSSTATFDAPPGFRIVNANAITVDTSNVKDSSVQVSKTLSTAQATANFTGKNKEFFNCPGGGHGAVRIIIDIAPD